MAVTVKKYQKDAEKKLKTLEQELGDEKGQLPPLVVPDHLKNETGVKKLTNQEKEERLLLLQKFLFRKIPKTKIAEAMGVSTRMVFKMVEELKERTLQDVSKMSFPIFVGESLAFYEEVRGMALVMSSDKNIKDPRVKLQAMNTALRAEEEKHKFLSLCGVYKSPTAQRYAEGVLTLTDKLNSGDQKVNPADVMAQFAKALLMSNPQDVKIIDADTEPLLLENPGAEEAEADA